MTEWQDELAALKQRLAVLEHERQRARVWEQVGRYAALPLGVLAVVAVVAVTLVNAHGGDPTRHVPPE